MMKLVHHFLNRQFAFFLVFGGCAAFTSIVTGWFLYRNEHAPFPYSLAVAIGAAAAILVNFGLNYAFNFHFRGRSLLAQLQTFALVALIGVFLTALSASVFYKIILIIGSEDWHSGDAAITAKLVAHILAVGLVTLYSFLAHKFFSFNVGFAGRLRNKLSTPHH
jgi:putative flippase GtrA